MLGYVYYSEKLILFFKPFDPKKSRAGRRISTFPVEKKIFYSLDFSALTTAPHVTKFAAFLSGKKYPVLSLYFERQGLATLCHIQLILR
jgi:hypothetical protein